MNKNKWHYIPKGTINIDLSSCRFVDEIHEKLKECFGFPDYYGKNWSAFWDCLDDFGLSEDAGREIVVCGIDKLPAELKDYTGKMVEIMRRAETKYPLIRFVFKDN